eukprot:31310-Pelagococcus_subviridis.AAC.13
MRPETPPGVPHRRDALPRANDVPDLRLDLLTVRVPRRPSLAVVNLQQPPVPGLVVRPLVHPSSRGGAYARPLVRGDVHARVHAVPPHPEPAGDERVVLHAHRVDERRVPPPRRVGRASPVLPLHRPRLRPRLRRHRARVRVPLAVPADDRVRGGRRPRDLFPRASIAAAAAVASAAAAQPDSSPEERSPFLAARLPPPPPRAPHPVRVRHLDVPARVYLRGGLKQVPTRAATQTRASLRGVERRDAQRLPGVQRVRGDPVHALQRADGQAVVLRDGREALAAFYSNALRRAVSVSVSVSVWTPTPVPAARATAEDASRAGD